MNANEQAVNDILTKRAAAIRAKDPKALLAPYAKDVITFDALAPLRNAGFDAVAKRLDNWFDGYDGPVDTELRDLVIRATDTLAFCHALSRTHGKLKGHGAIDMWVRLTMGLEKRNGTWEITHEHSSDPLDPESGHALMNLKP